MCQVHRLLHEQDLIDCEHLARVKNAIVDALKDGVDIASLYMTVDTLHTQKMWVFFNLPPCPNGCSKVHLAEPNRVINFPGPQCKRCLDSGWDLNAEPAAPPVRQEPVVPPMADEEFESLVKAFGLGDGDEDEEPHCHGGLR